MATGQVTFQTSNIASIAIEPCSVHSVLPSEHKIAVTEVQCPDSEVQAIQEQFPKLFSPGIVFWTCILDQYTILYTSNWMPFPIGPECVKPLLH